jgi:anti-sigma-K factor RskA
LGVSAHREEHLEACAAYALGSLDAAERAEFERHLAEGCPQCEAELERLSGAVSLLAASAPPVAPPAALRERVLAAARAEGRGPGVESVPPIPRLPRRGRSAATWAWAAAAVVLAVSTGVTWRVRERLDHELAASREQIRQLERQLADERSWAALLDSPTTSVVQLSMTPQGTAVLRAHAIYDPGSRRAVLVFDNLVTPPDSDYQLWGVHKSGPLSLGLIRADANGRAIIRVEDTGDPTTLAAFAVSLEREGGAPTATAPAGPVVMVGKLGS